MKMKAKTYSDEQLFFFPLYLTTIGIKFDEVIKIKRINGYEKHQIFMVDSGNGILNIGGQTFNLEKNDLFYIAANIPHEYYGNGKGFKTTYISFCGDGFEKIRKYYNLDDYGVYKNKNSGLFKSSVENLYEKLETIHELSALCSKTFSIVISYFDEVCKKEQSPIEKVYNYIEENYSKTITLEDILSVYPHSKTKLCNDFKEKYKATIFEMLTNIRLRHAHNMINSNPYITLKNVAISCGFNDVSYFCKMYKRFYNHSPKSEI
ncbi:MAG: helix-turn-helix transcriptional regulator [Clostridia bacterium]|nr:helix-turn-helix transcriptional regulator [Clostridia bacterium]